MIHANTLQSMRLLLALGAIAAPAGIAAAQRTIVVPDDIPTLGFALNPASSGLMPNDTIALQPGTYFGNFTITTPDITIRSVSGQATIDAFGTGRGFDITAVGGKTTFENIRIINADAGTDVGGAIHTQSVHAVEVVNCEFENNSAQQGGAIFTANANVTVESSTFTDNTAAAFAGAIRTRSNGANGPIIVSISDSLFDGNSALNGNGGALDHSGVNSGVNASIVMTDAVFGNNTCTGQGGAAFITQATNVSVTRCEFLDNIADGTVSADTGGLIVSGVTEANVRDCLFERNTCPGSGGALRFSNSGGNVFASRFVENLASAGGALQVVGADSEVRVFNSEFIGNSALNAGPENGAGGALLVNSGFAEVFVFNSLFANNDAITGGAIAADIQGKAFVENATFSNNTAETSGGAVRRLSSDADTVLNNCIVWGNFPMDSQIWIAGGGLDEVNFSIVEGGYDTEPGRNNIDADPLFVDPTGGDYALMPGSPAIDAGSSILYTAQTLSDLAGNPRGQDDPTTPDTGETLIGAVIDMGAFEFVGEATTPSGCPGDADGDGQTTTADLTFVVSNLGCTPE